MVGTEVYKRLSVTEGAELYKNITFLIDCDTTLSLKPIYSSRKNSIFTGCSKRSKDKAPETRDPSRRDGTKHPPDAKKF
jgi:hypothetical protein